MTWGVFVCMDCAGVHRALSFRTKGILMSSWSQEEADFLKSKGNKTVNARLLAYFQGRRPSPGDRETVKQHIRQKYVDGAWTSPSGRSQGAPVPAQQPTPAETALVETAPEPVATDDFATFEDPFASQPFVRVEDAFEHKPRETNLLDLL